MLTDKIRRLLSANRLEEAFDLLLAITKMRDAKTHDQLVLLLSSHNANTFRSQLGMINFEQASIERNKIVSTLLSILGIVEQSEYSSGVEEAALLKEMEDEDLPREKLLFVAANPQGTPKFQLEKEYLDLRRIFRKKRTRFEITESFNTTLDGLYEVIGEERPSFLHFALPPSAIYLLLHKYDDSIHAIPYSLLASSFALLRPYVKCIFLNTQTSPVFLKKVSRMLGYAIGWEEKIPDRMAVDFSAGFYTGIAQGEDIEAAFNTGVKLLEKYMGGGNRLSKNSIMLFKDGNCVNKEDNYQETFLNDGYSINESNK